MTWTERFTQTFEAYLDFFVVQFTAPSLTAPITVIVVVLLACLLLEAKAPRKRDWGLSSRRGFRLDLLYVVWMDLVVYPAGLLAFLVASEGVAMEWLHRWGLPDPLPFSAASLPAPFALLAVFLLLDFAEWAGHYALHRVPLLWRFHKIHHAQTTLGFASTRRFHFVELVVLQRQESVQKFS